MSGPQPERGPAPFNMRELDGVGEAMPDEVAAETRLARELEALADRAGVAPSAEFADRVMTAVSREPVPAPARAAGIALRRGSLAALAASLRDAWRVTTRPGFPIAVRAQALALVLAAAGLVAGSGLATAGAIGMFSGDHATPSPLPSLETSQVPSVVPEGTSPPLEFATPPGEPSVSPEPTSSLDEATSEPQDGGDGEGNDGGGGAAPPKTSSPTRRPAPTRTPSPTHTEDPEDGGGGDHSERTPQPSQTPTPSPTPPGDD